MENNTPPATSKLGETPKLLLWLDMEFTGLEVENDVITEVALIVTDFEFNELAEFETGVVQDETVLDRSEWFKIMGESYKRNMIKVSLGGMAPEAVDAKLVQIINEHWGSDGQAVILAGNSIHSDRAFIRRYMPGFEAKLHYRMLDVTAWKVYMQGRFGLQYAKSEAHRALDDIRESIEELKMYTEKINISTGDQDDKDN